MSRATPRQKEGATFALHANPDETPNGQRLIVFVVTTNIEAMKLSTSSASKAKTIGSPEEALFLELFRTTDILSRGVVLVVKAEDLSPTQYNVLRILRGAPDGLACGEIGNRMVTRDPDITRLLDRLEKRGLITRWRVTADRRVVMARITPEGLRLLARLDGPIQKAHRRQLAHLGPKRLRQLTALLRLARSRAG